MTTALATKAPALHPTLWRTCRVLANITRLKIFDLLRQDQPQAVSAVAERLNLTLPVASQSLRAMEARGFLTSSRRNRRVLYRLNLNPDALLVGPVRLTFQHQSLAIERVFKLATAFTHPRRIEIYRALTALSRTRGQLQSFTRIPDRTLRRHLAKLESRGFVQLRHGTYCTIEHSDTLERALARLASV